MKKTLQYLLVIIVIISCCAAGSFVGNYLFKRFNKADLDYFYEMGYDAGLKNIGK